MRPQLGNLTRTQKTYCGSVAWRFASGTSLTTRVAHPRCEVAVVSRRDGTRLWLQRREKSRAPAVRHGFEGAAEAPAVTVWRARRKHQHYDTIEVPDGDYIQGPYGRLAVPNRNACRQRAIAICDLNCGPFPCTSGPESGTNFGARFRHQNKTAAAQV